MLFSAQKSTSAWSLPRISTTSGARAGVACSVQPGFCPFVRLGVKLPRSKKGYNKQWNEEPYHQTTIIVEFQDVLNIA